MCFLRIIDKSLDFSLKILYLCYHYDCVKLFYYFNNKINKKECGSKIKILILLTKK